MIRRIIRSVVAHGAGYSPPALSPDCHRQHQEQDRPSTTKTCENDDDDDDDDDEDDDDDDDADNHNHNIITTTPPPTSHQPTKRVHTHTQPRCSLFAKRSIRSATTSVPIAARRDVSPQRIKEKTTNPQRGYSFKFKSKSSWEPRIRCSRSSSYGPSIVTIRFTILIGHIILNDIWLTPSFVTVSEAAPPSGSRSRKMCSTLLCTMQAFLVYPNGSSRRCMQRRNFCIQPGIHRTCRLCTDAPT